MATVWWWVVPESESGASSRPSDARLVSTPDSGAEYEAFVTNNSYNGMSAFQGPFTSQSQAKAAAAGGGSTGDVIKAGLYGAAAGSQNPIAEVASAASGAGIPGLGALDAFFAQLTKASMWRSLGWLLLGGAFTGAGIFWWAKNEGIRGVSQIARGRKPELTAPVMPLGLMIIGLYLLWFGVKYWEDTKTIWPSDPVKDVLQGKGLPGRSPDASASQILGATDVAATGSQEAGSTASGAFSGAAAIAGAAAASGEGPQAQASGLLAKYGWPATQLPALVSLWNRESGWNAKARNPSSGAFGIAQALGHGVPGGAAPDGTNEYGGYGLTAAQAREANAGNSYWQIVWGLSYIKSTYGSPAAAWSHEESNGWY